MRYTRLRRSLVSMIGISLLAAYAAMAQTYTIPTVVISSGGGTVTAGSYTISHTLGQPIVGAGQASGYTHAEGFWSQYGKSTGGITGGGGGIIVYSRSGNPDGTIWVRATDGSFDSMLCVGERPQLSHNGKYIAHHKGSSSTVVFQDLYVYDIAAKTDLLLETNFNSYIENCGWSDDDSTIVFDHNCAVRAIGRDGTNARTIFQVDCYDDWPSLRPHASAIVWHNAFSGIMLTDSLSVNRHTVPNTSPGSYLPSWSADGEWIAFAAVAGDTLRNYYKIHPDGSSLTALTHFSNSEAMFFWSGSAWTPDGSKLLVAARINGVEGLFALATDGSGAFAHIPTVPGAPVDFLGTVTGPVDIVLTGVHDAPQSGRPLPTVFQLSENYPNPFNPSTTIEYALPMASRVTLVVYDLLGREVSRIVSGVEEAGYKSVRWAPDAASGMYFCRLEAVALANPSDRYVRVTKLILAK